MISFLSPTYRLRNFVNLSTNACPIIYVAANKPIITCLGYQSNPKKYITRKNISCEPFYIHKSKLVMVKIKFINFGKTYTYFVFSTKLGNIS
jgi:hypothetical protein